MPAIRLLVSTTTPALWLLIVTAGPSAAATCADHPVSARGDASRYAVLAKAKARGNWRAKVRAMPALGAAYADFNKAMAADYRCDQRDGRFVCLAVALPCQG